jgi:hypothetical protein
MFDAIKSIDDSSGEIRKVMTEQLDFFKWQGIQDIWPLILEERKESIT